MANVSIAQFIKSIASEITTENVFIYGKRGFQNLFADNALELIQSRCLIFLDEPITSNDDFTQGGAVFSSYNIKMLFAKKSDLRWTFEQHDVVISQMRSVSRDFILHLLASTNPDDNTKNIKSISNVSRTNVQNVKDVNLSGVVCSFQIVPFNDDGVCIDFMQPKLNVSVSYTCAENGDLSVAVQCEFSGLTGLNEIIFQGKSHFADEFTNLEIVSTDLENGTVSIVVVVPVGMGQGNQIDIRCMINSQKKIISNIVETVLQVCTDEPTVVGNDLEQTCNGEMLECVAHGTFWNADGFTTINLQGSIDNGLTWILVGTQPTNFAVDGLISIAFNIALPQQGMNVLMRLQLSGNPLLPIVYSPQFKVAFNNCTTGTFVQIINIEQ